MEVRRNLVESLAPSLRHPKERIYEEKEEERRKYQEDVWSTEVLRKKHSQVKALKRECGSFSIMTHSRLVKFIYSQQHIESTCQ